MRDHQVGQSPSQEIGQGSAARSRALWNAKSDAWQAGYGRVLEAAPAAWGTLRIPESEVAALDDVENRDVLDLGCGSGHWARALREQGARAVGLDVSERQLHHARKGAGKSGALPVVQASADRLPLSDQSFDLVLSDGGALTWCDPELVLPEVARVLRPGGLLAFCATTAFAVSHWGPEDDLPGETLRHPYFGSARHYPDGAVRFAQPHGRWIDLLLANGFAVERLIELRPGPHATSPYPALIEWMRDFPFEEVWSVRRTSRS